MIDKWALRSSSTVRDGAVVATIQGAGAILRFGFQLVLARALLPAAFADVAVALGWSQVIAAAAGGGGGALLLTALPSLTDRTRALPLYRGTLRATSVGAALIAVAVASGLAVRGASGGTAAGIAVLATAPVRAALLATQEGLRAVGVLALSQILTLLVQPAISTALVALLAIGSGAADARVAGVALLVGLTVAFGVGRQRLARAVGRPGASLAVEYPAPRLFLRYGASSALLVWMFEGPLVLSGLAIANKGDLAMLNAHIRLSMGTALMSVAISTVVSSHWARRIREGQGPPGLRDALRWSGIGAAAAGLTGCLLFVTADKVIGAFGEAYVFSPWVLGGLVFKDTCLAAASPLFYFLAMRGREGGAAKASSMGGVAMLVVVPLAIASGIRGACVGTALAGAVWLCSYLVAAARVER